MTSIRVLLPVLKGKISFVVDKGRHWSVVEHLLLDALAKREWSTNAFADYGKLPRRVVVETIVRLMRAGWVELNVDGGEVKFRATEIGKHAASHADLPRSSDLQKRPTNYILDIVCGEIFRNKDLLTQSEQEVRKGLDAQPSVWVKPRSWHSQVEVGEALQVLLDPDETFVSGQPGGIYRRWVVVVVRGGRIVSGLPETRSLEALRQVVIEAAAEADTSGSATVEPSDAHEFERAQPARAVLRSIAFDLQDLVLGGNAHRDVLLALLATARTSVYIHSTFISTSRVLDLLVPIQKAIEKGVHIHIFWGQNEDPNEIASTRSAISELRRNIQIQALAEHLTFHPFSTGSHAKLLLADAGQDGAYVAAVGSCNWLTSAFASYEVSVLLRDPRLVEQVVRCLGRLVCMHDGLWSELAGNIALLSQSLQATPAGKSAGEGSIVVGAQHNELVLRARDEARKFILLTSHRLGVAAGPGILAPLVSAATDNPNLSIDILYCHKTSPVRGADERRLTSEATSFGVSLLPIQSPKIHAKLLVWDDDNAVVTSLNWLSADQTQSNSLGEIGVHLKVPGVGKRIKEHLRAETAADS